MILHSEYDKIQKQFQTVTLSKSCFSYKTQLRRDCAQPSTYGQEKRTYRYTTLLGLCNSAINEDQFDHVTERNMLLKKIQARKMSL